jgi:hypothetical protein
MSKTLSQTTATYYITLCETDAQVVGGVEWSVRITFGERKELAGIGLSIAKNYLNDEPII